ncbi:MAG: malto-oligosyltrehalose synthase [Rhizobium sp.]|nr:MAG: malto-oligosyltrehalose synthase [Rhizobium sp.]
MIAVTSTYRLQFRDGVTFERAIARIPYLQELGISHLYASPVFTATAGSTHGYDVTDPNEIDPALGGREAFDNFCAALQRAGLGLILDIVPNHMAASIENAWWRDILRHGQRSAYAAHFDVDWSRKLTLPQLAKPLREILAARELGLRHEPADGLIYLIYFDSLFPLSDESAEQVMAQTGADIERLRAFSTDIAAMEALLEKQCWQLLCWKDAADPGLSYRRFFEVAGLVGMRVESASVFDDMHRLVTELVREGQVQGLRIDHIDGLTDPKGYLERLRKAVGPDTFIVVEKILGHGEALPADWPVSGTTGYEFISAMADLFVSEKGLCELDDAYRSLDGENADIAEGLRKAKLLMVERNFRGETLRLIRLATSVFPAFSEMDISAAVRELLIAFPVYRTYGCQGGTSPEDQAVIDRAIAGARARLSVADALEGLGRLLKGEDSRAEAVEFRVRFQQLSGPVMAKSVEDTLFYRYNRLIAMNEVGGEADISPGALTSFHQFMRDRLRRQRHGLSATSTHDTKRGEDARARLYSLSQRPKDWVEGVARWRRMNAPFRRILTDGPAPEPNIEWMLYQALAGVWPEDIEIDDGGELEGRFAAYALKAIREAKLRTDWMDENPAYERAVETYANALLSKDHIEFRRDFELTLRPFMEFGYRNSLSQLLIKLTAPGIPDIYQGADGLDFSLVDPDNRRPIDHPYIAARTIAGSAELKRHVIRKVLSYRNDHPSLFLEGDYVPLEAKGARACNLVAFARVRGEEVAVTIVPRLAEHHSPDFWEDTAVTPPPALQRQMRDLLTDRRSPGGDLPAVQLFADHPISILVGHS